MFNYLLRRILLAIPIVFGVMLITFVLFHVLLKPESRAKLILGPKASPQAVQNWLHQRGYDKPVFINLAPSSNPFDSQFFHHVKALATFDLGVSDSTQEPVIEKFRKGALPSLLITFPAFVVGLVLAVSISLFLAYVRESRLDFAGIIVSVILMSVPAMVYVIFAQWLFGVVLKYFPAFGFSMTGLSSVRFLFLPVAILVIAGLGSDIRLYRAIFLEEMRNDYVRTANAKGLSTGRVLLCHVFKNGLINLITLTVAALPTLILGSLVLEPFFGIPGLGDMSLQAIRSADFATILSTTYVGSLLILVGLLLTDVCYAFADPRVKLK
jgi:peptide/nickel transport system permease protein